MESRPQHRTSVGGGTAWHRCDYGEKNAEGFFVQLKLQVVCSLRTVPDPVAHSPRYTHVGSQNKASPRNSTDSSVPAWPFAFMRQLSPQPTHRPAGRTDSSSSPSRIGAQRDGSATPFHAWWFPGWGLSDFIVDEAIFDAGKAKPPTGMRSTWSRARSDLLSSSTSHALYVAVRAAIKVQWKHLQKCETVLQSADDPQKFEKCAQTDPVRPALRPQ